ncbi:MAG: hypothetical protein KF851_04065 [Pirellulaceae bacterium]|nr:hypothetical protein [Pirellulaceae bacterium]
MSFKRSIAGWWSLILAILARDWTRSNGLMFEYKLHQTIFGKSLSRLVIGQVAKRARWQVANSGFLSGWQSLCQTENILPNSLKAWYRREKNELIELTLAHAERRLVAGDHRAALKIVRELSGEEILDWRADRIAAVAQLIEQAERLAKAERFAEAISKIALAFRQRSDLHYLGTRLSSLKQQQQMALVEPPRPFIDGLERISLHDHLAMPQSWVMWIDGVGSFLICRGEATWLGRYVDQPQVDIAIQGELARRHAIFRKTKFAYQLDSFGPMRVNGTEVNEGTSLKHQDLIEIGEVLKIRFENSDPRSRSAILRSVTPMRTFPRCDGVILLHDWISVGPKQHNHLRIPHLHGELEFRIVDGRLTARVRSGEMQVDGPRVGDQAVVVGCDTRLTLDGVGIQWEAVNPPLPW